MDLWVRTQDKKDLINIHYIYITENGFISTITDDMELQLGQYETEERALEVLEEIQQLIEDLQYMSYAIPNDKFTAYKPNVYKMPKE